MENEHVGIWFENGYFIVEEMERNIQLPLYLSQFKWFEQAVVEFCSILFIQDSSNKKEACYLLYSEKTSPFRLIFGVRCLAHFWRKSVAVPTGFNERG